MNYVFIVEVEVFANSFDSTTKTLTFSKPTDGLIASKGTIVCIGDLKSKVKKSYMELDKNVVVTVVNFVLLHEPEEVAKITDQLISNGFIQLK